MFVKSAAPLPGPALLGGVLCHARCRRDRSLYRWPGCLPAAHPTSAAPRNPPGCATFACRQFLTLHYICFYERAEREKFAMNNLCVIVFKIQSYFSKETTHVSVPEIQRCFHVGHGPVCTLAPTRAGTGSSAWRGWAHVQMAGNTRIPSHAQPARVPRQALGIVPRGAQASLPFRSVSDPAPSAPCGVLTHGHAQPSPGRAQLGGTDTRSRCRI